MSRESLGRGRGRGPRNGMLVRENPMQVSLGQAIQLNPGMTGLCLLKMSLALRHSMLVNALGETRQSGIVEGQQSSDAFACLARAEAEVPLHGLAQERFWLLSKPHIQDCQSLWKSVSSVSTEIFGRHAPGRPVGISSQCRQCSRCAAGSSTSRAAAGSSTNRAATGSSTGRAAAGSSTNRAAEDGKVTICIWLTRAVDLDTAAPVTVLANIIMKFQNATRMRIVSRRGEKFVFNSLLMICE